MTEPIATLTAIAIANLAFKKFVESAAGEVAKKAMRNPCMSDRSPSSRKFYLLIIRVWRSCKRT
jgi:hypothetical protein